MFAIDTHSIFGQRIKKETDCLVVDSQNAMEIVNTIKSIQNNYESKSQIEFFEKNMKKTKNSKLYSDLIVGENSCI